MKGIVMTRKDFVAIALQANPTYTRRQRAFVRITSPVLTPIANRQVKKQMNLIVESLSEQIAKTK
jgi:hypothetical protein